VPVRNFRAGLGKTTKYLNKKSDNQVEILTDTYSALPYSFLVHLHSFNLDMNIVTYKLVATQRPLSKQQYDKSFLGKNSAKN
jgi:hypothetical protein